MKISFWWDFAENSIVLESDDPKFPILERWDFKPSDLRKLTALEKRIYGEENEEFYDASKYIEEAEKLISDFESGRLNYKKYIAKGNVPVCRMRRGKVVEIPKQWLGKITTNRTKRIRKQNSLQKKLERRKRLKLDFEFDSNNQNNILNDLVNERLKKQIEQTLGK